MAEHEDPIVGFHFSLDFGGVVAGYFTECSGIGSEHEIINIKWLPRMAGMKIPGRLKWRASPGADHQLNGHLGLA
jgi:hypothetical protein